MKQRVVVIGGGVIGAAVAWHLLERGVSDVTLLERDRPGSGTTWHSVGNITWKPTPDSDGPIGYLFKFINRLEQETGATTGWLKTGRLFLYSHGRADKYMLAPQRLPKAYSTCQNPPAQAQTMTSGSRQDGQTISPSA